MVISFRVGLTGLWRLREKSSRRFSSYLLYHKTPGAKMEKAICPEIFPGKPRGYPAFLGQKRGFSQWIFHNVQKSAANFPEKMNFALPDPAKTGDFQSKKTPKCIRNCVFPKSGDKITEELQKCIKKGLTRCPGGYNCITTKAFRPRKAGVEKH